MQLTRDGWYNLCATHGTIDDAVGAIGVVTNCTIADVGAICVVANVATTDIAVGTIGQCECCNN